MMTTSLLVGFLLVGVCRAGAAAAPADDLAAPPAFASFDAMKEWFSARRESFALRARKLLEERYDLSDRPSKEDRMSRGKPVQEGVRAKLPPGVTWQALAEMSPETIRERGFFPAGFMPLPHPNHP